MNAEVGTAVIDALEIAARRHLKESVEIYDQFLWQIHGAGTLRNYDGTDVYWTRVQATLDFFFTSEQRAEICRMLMQQAKLEGRPECRSFQACAVAECHIAELNAGMKLAARAAGPCRKQLARRAWRSLPRS